MKSENEMYLNKTFDLNKLDEVSEEEIKYVCNHLRIQFTMAKFFGSPKVPPKYFDRFIDISLGIIDDLDNGDISLRLFVHQFDRLCKFVDYFHAYQRRN